MRVETQPWNAIRIAVEVVVFGAGQTGLTPTVQIQRISDSQYLANGGGSWAAGVATNNMVEVDATNQPGRYEYEIPAARLDYAEGAAGYRVTIVESTNSVLENVLVRQERDPRKDTVAEGRGFTIDQILGGLFAATVATEDDLLAHYTCTFADATGAKFYGATPAVARSAAYADRAAVLYRPAQGNGYYSDLLKITGIANDANGDHFTLTRPDGSALDAPGVSVGDELVVLQRTLGSDEAAIADAVWDEALSGHLTEGTAGDALWRGLALRQNVRVIFTAWTSKGQPTAGYMLLYTSKAALEADVSPWTGAAARLDFTSPHSGAAPQSYVATRTS